VAKLAQNMPDIRSRMIPQTAHGPAQLQNSWEVSEEPRVERKERENKG
jgi:hypothetical protein